FHEAKSEIQRDHAGSVCRNAALLGAQDQAYAQRQYNAARNLHELPLPQADSRRNAGMNVKQSELLMSRAQESIPGGVNSPVRALRAVGGSPRFVARGEGSHLFDVDGNDYIDYIGSWGPLILGHKPKPVMDAIAAALELGTSFGAPTGREVELAELIIDA